MKPRELRNLGLPQGDALKAATRACADARLPRDELRTLIRALIADPATFVDHPEFGTVASMMVQSASSPPPMVLRETPAPWRQWGEDLDPASVQQLADACSLPISVRGALMPDAHLGYGLPIGGVLATDNAVIPYAVGVDIACRMKLTVLDIPTTALHGQTDRLVNAIESETRFGIGAKFDSPHAHDVMDDDWTISPVTARFKDKAWQQLGSSGSGNHFVEFGELTLEQSELGLDPGTYLALLSHSGSRGVGAQVANHYSRIAMERHPDLPKSLRHLAWLSLDDEAGAEYWAAMTLMGAYAAANHAVIHASIAKHLGARVMADVENHHNFAWKETHDGRDVIVHRKGATPAGDGVLGIIPGSMASPAYVVRGTGSDDALHSASHGAGRMMSRRQARSSLTWSDARRLLRERNVHLISAGLDEVPFVYKSIEDVMASQDDLVRVIARFDPRIVKMAPEGERPED
ncbi:MAG: RtcB family protein [Planctomycetota bacterium]